MNIFFLRKLGLVAVLICARFAQAGPSELNYQGVVLDSSGNGVTGTQAMTVKLYDAAIGGNLLYTEDLGNVSVNRGVYSFNFGTNGIGNPKVTETVAVVSGTNSTFQKVLGNTNVVAGSVAVTDGAYTWDQINGSSDGGVNFNVSFNVSLRKINVNYNNSVPVVGKRITVTYRSPSAGLAGILTNEKDPWLEVSVGGETQAIRQKLQAVPFALRAAKVDSLEPINFQETVEVDFPIKAFNEDTYFRDGDHWRLQLNRPLPNGFGTNSYPSGKNLYYDLPFYIKEILYLTVNYSVFKGRSDWSGIDYLGRLDFGLTDSSGQNLVNFSFPRVEAEGITVNIPLNKTIPTGDCYKISFSIDPGDDRQNDSRGGGAYVNSVTARVKALKSMGFQ